MSQQEGPPQKQERGPVTQEQVKEAMATKPPDMETVQAWYAQEAARADKDPTGKGRMDLTVNMGATQIEGGHIELGMGSLGAALEDANGLGLLKAAGIIMETIKQLE